MPKSLLERFHENIVRIPESGCWIWMGFTNPKGYGLLTVNSKNKFSHRLSWELHNGTIDSGLLVCHRCDIPPCVNPDHLFLGTPKDNAQDMIKKGRRATSKRRTHCFRSHELTPENTRTEPWGKRQCKFCIHLNYLNNSKQMCFYNPKE